jgi:hypothetical protein
MNTAGRLESQLADLFVRFVDCWETLSQFAISWCSPSVRLHCKRAQYAADPLHLQMSDGCHSPKCHI